MPDRFSAQSERPRWPAPRELTFDRAGVREVDRRCVEQFGVPSLVLMENAARALAKHALRVLAGATDKHGGPVGALFVCGPGANGGDGFAAARHMHNAGAPVLIACTHDPDAARGDAAVNLHIARTMGITIETLEEADPAGSLRAIAVRAGAPGVILDCMLGTGLDRPLDDRLSGVAQWINSRRPTGAKVVACDIPSGLDCDIGAPVGGASGACVRADSTVTMCGVKKGFRARGARAYTGLYVIGDIGAPRQLLEELALES